MSCLNKDNPLFPLVSAAVSGILGITPGYFRNDYVALLDGLCVVGLLLNSYLYATRRNSLLVTIAALGQLIYCLGASSMDAEEEFIYTRVECLQGLGMRPVGDGGTLAAAALVGALAFIMLEILLVIKLLVSFSKMRYGIERN